MNSNCQKAFDTFKSFLKDSNHFFTNHMTKSAIDHDRRFLTDELPDETINPEEVGQTIALVLQMKEFRKNAETVLPQIALNAGDTADSDEDANYLEKYKPLIDNGIYTD